MVFPYEDWNGNAVAMNFRQIEKDEQDKSVVRMPSSPWRVLDCTRSIWRSTSTSASSTYINSSFRNAGSYSERYRKSSWGLQSFGAIRN
jgi:hypothetical protein